MFKMSSGIASEVSEDSNSSSTELASWGGIEAKDLGSLLVQFEDASQSFDGFDSCSSKGRPNSLNFIKTPKVGSCTEQPLQKSNSKKCGKEIMSSKAESTQPLGLLPEVLEKIRARRKRKLAIMLPVMMASIPKKDQGRQPLSTASPSKVQKTSAKSCTAQPKTSVTEKSCTSTSNPCSRLSASTVNMDDIKTGTGVNVDSSVVDHDYCSTGSSLTADNEVEIMLDANTDIDAGCVGSEIEISEQLSCDSGINGSFDSSGLGSVGPMRNLTCDGLEEGEVVDDNGNINDVGDNVLGDKENERSRSQKYTLLKKTSGGKRHYRERHEESPMIMSDEYFDKLPSYCTDLSMPAKPPKKKPDSNKEITLLDYISRDPSPTRDSAATYSKLPAYHNCFTNSTRYDGCMSKEPVTKKNKKYLRTYRTRESRSRSRSFSRSRSRSRSSDRGRSRRRRSYSSDSGSSSDSRSWSYSSTDSSRSRSSSRDSRYSCASQSRSSDRYKAKRRQKRAEQKKQIEERRIVYVGKIPDGHTRKQLRNRFARFGEIESVSTHFRENRDNYGFVTFAYTCDAYAAIEKGNDIPGEQKFDLCFGGRREFCDVDYMDLDGNTEYVEEYAPQPQPRSVLDFDHLLKRAQQKLKRK
ncbi:peroxisome proliferator-activated receptor gamma coactivator 1-alpha-like [Gigantopelta aegis]|uniref:peroxisome proliferator-activated receptor gamma coactivator 1-alpha-like n=1 Tax=Gigantopelta aegis TaxID=1735272 RepID=UPI001B88A27B|nr:peroxisome proliferator-activated receptor gamma coactivator 1-alpha-like [Gigantopelta aegis]